MQFQNNFVIAVTCSNSNIIDYFNLCAQQCWAPKHSIKYKKKPQSLPQQVYLPSIGELTNAC